MREMKDSGVPWIGEIPKDWNIRQANQVFECTKKLNIGLVEKNLLSLSYGHIIRRNIESTFGLLPESFEGYNIIDKDTIVLRLTDLQNDQKSLRVGLSEERGIITSAYLALKCHSTDYPTYLYYLMHCFDLVKGFYGMGGGIRQGLTWDGIKNLRFYIPPFDEQHRIADFLDGKCAEIDTIQEKTRASIECYKKLKQSVITEAVTKGIRGDRPMKYSGVEWIGEIPRDSFIIKMGQVIKDYKAGPFGSSLITGNLLSEGKILVYTPEHIAKMDVALDSNLFLQEERLEEMSQFIVSEGDIVFPIVGSLGRAMRITETMPLGIINQRLSKFRLNNAKVDTDFFMWVFGRSSFYSTFIELNQRGAIIVNLTKEIVRNMPIVLHPLSEQQEIAAYLDEKCAALDSLIASKESLVTELESYKKSLIYEYVTGKKEV